MAIYDMKTKTLDKTEQKNMPVAKFRIGTVAIAKWQNKSKDGNDFNTFTIDVSYFDDKTGQYKAASAFSKNQLMNLKICIDRSLASDVKES